MQRNPMQIGSVGACLDATVWARWLLVSLAVLLLPDLAWAHEVADGDAGYIRQTGGVLIVPFIYLGAKHMVTGYDHLLFLLGVVFFLYRPRDVGLYVTLFAVGHSITMIGGVLADIRANAYLVDAVIGLSVVYKALDNMGAFERWFGINPSTKVATFGFGLVHGFGLATKLLEFEITPGGLVPNLLAFNVGVEIGQLLALGAILIAMGAWRRSPSFTRYAFAANAAILVAGMLLTAQQLAGYFATT